MPGDRGLQAGIGGTAPGQRPIGTDALGTRRSMGDDLHVDPGLVHLRYPPLAEIRHARKQRRAGPRCVQGGVEIIIPERIEVMLLKGNDHSSRSPPMPAGPLTQAIDSTPVRPAPTRPPAPRRGWH